MVKCSDYPSDFEPKNSGTMTDVETGKEIRFDIERQVCLTQTDKPDKFLVLQELKFDGGKKEIRIGYYIRVKKEGSRKGKWWWGESCPFVLRDDLVELIKKAQIEGILPEEIKPD